MKEELFGTFYNPLKSFKIPNRNILTLVRVYLLCYVTQIVSFQPTSWTKDWEVLTRPLAWLNRDNFIANNRSEGAEVLAL